jgi:excisionase family DNA binding protein
MKNPASHLHKLRLLTLNATAETLSISKRTLQRMIAAGEFPAPIKVGPTTRIRLEDLEHFIERQQRKGAH